MSGATCLTQASGAIYASFMNTVLVEDDEAALTDAVQVLIEEAWRRNRRRWLLRGVVAVVSALAIGIALALSFGAGSGSPPVHRPHSNRPSIPLASDGHRTIDGRLVPMSDPADGRALTLSLSGTIRFVAEGAGKTYSATLVGGRWKMAIPPGRYTVEGQGPGWGMMSRLVVVQPGKTHETIAVVPYGKTGK